MLMVPTTPLFFEDDEINTFLKIVPKQLEFISIRIQDNITGYV